LDQHIQYLQAKLSLQINEAVKSVEAKTRKSNNLKRSQAASAILGILMRLYAGKREEKRQKRQGLSIFQILLREIGH